MTLTITFRPARFAADVLDPEDLRAAADIHRAENLAVLGSVETGEGEVAEMWTMPTVDRDVTGFLEHDGDVVGLLWVENDATAHQTYVGMTVPPSSVSRAARDHALNLALEASRRHQSAANGGAWTVRAGHWKGITESEEVLADHDFVPVRQFHRMRIESTSPAIPESAPALPEGTELVVAKSMEECREVYLVDNESFLDHWNFTPRDWDEWWSFFGTSPTRDPDGWWLLRVGGEPAAIVVMEETRTEFNEGYIGILGVRREFRGRGLAQLLLQRAFIRFRDMGRTATQLGVDAANTTGAVRLYEKLGMIPVRTSQGWAKELD
jgi:ribosomal protein S18 acetylase RimI-like enzyme